jgi:hypothetical protein
MSIFCHPTYIRITPSTGEIKSALSYPVVDTLISIVFGYDPVNNIMCIQIQSYIEMYTYGYDAATGDLLWNNTQAGNQQNAYSLNWDPVTELFYGITSGNKFITVNSKTGRYKVIGMETEW